MEKIFSKIAGDNRILNYLILGRPWNGLLIGLISVVAYLMLSTQPEFMGSFALFVSFILIYMAGTTINDTQNIKEDKLNMPYRPLEREILSVSDAKIFAYLLYGLSFIISAYYGLLFFFGIFLFFILTILYSYPPFSFDKKSFLGTITLSLVTIFLPAVTGGFFAINSIDLPLNFILTFAFMSVFFSSIVLMKDFKDIEGDTKSDKITPVVKFGFKKIGILAILLAAIFMPLTLFYLFQFVNQQFLIIASIFLLILIIWEEQKGISSSAIERIKMFSLLRIYTILFVFAIFISLLLARFI